MTKYLTIFVIIALFLTGILTYQLSKDPSRLVPIQDEESTVSSGVNEFQYWYEFSAPNGKFKVQLPILPQQATENISDKNTGETRKYDMYVAEKQDGTIFMISLITFQNLTDNFDKDKLMRTMMNDMLESNPNNELHSVEMGKYKGLDSLDFSFGNAEMTIDAKTFIVDDTLYVLTRILKSQDHDPNEFNFFINSFDLSSETQTSE